MTKRAPLCVNEAMRPTAGIVAVLLLLAGCQSEPLSAVQYVEYKDDAPSLMVWVTGCNPNAPVDVEESSTKVRLTVTAAEREDGCSDSIVVDLPSPVGDRVVIDSETGKEITRVVSINE